MVGCTPSHIFTPGQRVRMWEKWGGGHRHVYERVEKAWCTPEMHPRSTSS